MKKTFLKYGYLIRGYSKKLNINFDDFIKDEETHELSQDFIANIDKFIIKDKEQFITDMMTYLRKYSINKIIIDMSNCCFKSLNSKCDETNLVYSCEFRKIKKGSFLLTNNYGFVVGKNKFFSKYTLFVVLNFKALENEILKESTISMNKKDLIDSIRNEKYDNIIKNIKDV